MTLPPCLTRHHRSLSASILALFMLVATVAVGTQSASAATNGLRVNGTAIVNNVGQSVKLRGVNRSGAEYACGHGDTNFYNTTLNKADTASMRSWNINLVRLPLNEHCWLGISGVPQSTGPAYRNAIVDYVEHLNANDIYVLLDLHFTSPWGPGNGDQRNPMANRRYSVPFWTSVATTFKSNNSVGFELFNEPHDLAGDQWDCWLNGCETWGYQTAGMQEMLSAVRATGAKNIVVVNGIDWGHDMSQMLAHLPSDSAGQLVAGQHLYDFKRCRDENCWNNEFAPVGRVLPLLAPEIGIDACEGSFITRFMKWMDANGGDGYGFWHWGKGSCPAGEPYGGAALFNWDGSVSDYGAAVRSHFTAQSGTPNTSPPTTSTPTTSSPAPSTPTTTTTAPPTTTPAAGPRPAGYRTVTTTGQVFGFGSQSPLPGPSIPAGTEIVAIANTEDARGYWLVSSTGKVFAYGNAPHRGDMDGQFLKAPIVGMTRTAAGDGYWLLGRDGGVFSFGAPFFGSTGSLTLNSPVVAMVAAPNGNGYWFVAEDGGVFAYGPGAPFRGSMGDVRLNKPVVGMTADPRDKGYWLVASDGGVFSFGVPFHGSTGDIVLNAPIVGISASSAGDGYRFVATDGGIFTFPSSLPFYGSSGGAPPAAPVRSMAG